MSITAEMVKDLRERTGAPMMACKQALVETDGDAEKAIELMRKKGQSQAEKKSTRTTAEGIVVAKRNDMATEAILLEVNSETDFVAREEGFLKFADEVAQLALSQSVSSIEELSSLKLNNGLTVEEARKALVAKIGENIQLRRLDRLQGEYVGTYVHFQRIGVLVALNRGKEKEAKDMAMQIAAQSPIVVQSSQVPKALVDKEREIQMELARQSGKPEAILEKMVAGRIQKFMQEMSLYGQAFIKDPNITVENFLKQADAEVASFVRFVVGEGLEKKTNNFAEEVEAQIKASEKG